MTNSLSLLGKVNGGGRGVYGDSEKLGGFCGKGDFLLRIADCRLRIWGGESYVSVASFCGRAAAHRALVRRRADGRFGVDRENLHLDAHNCGLLGFYFCPCGWPRWGRRRFSEPSLPSKSPVMSLLSLAIACCRIFEGGGGG
jgi:hypothetical protein